MPIDLIYHTPDSMAGGISPFDDAIMQMIKGQDLCIACPYLGLDYFKRMIRRAKNWRLLTDIEEWLASHALDSRRSIVDFIAEHRERIRHCKDLHAKVLVAGDAAIAGSANFTMKGITGRVEVSTRFEDCDQVDELRVWFESVWQQANLPTVIQIEAASNSLPVKDGSIRVSLESKTPPVSSILSGSSVSLSTTEAENRLVDRISLAPTRLWADNWLELARGIVEATGLTADDQRLVMSLPAGKFLPITINRRYVLSAFRLEPGHHEKHWITPDYIDPVGFAVAEMILPSWMEEQIERMPGIIRHGAFHPGFTGENEENVPRFASFSVASEFDFSPTVIDALHEACIAERDKQRVSNFRKFHEPVVYRAVTDRDYRESILDRAFTAM